MEYFSITKTDAGLHIEGFSDAVKVIRIDESQSKRLAALSLHETNLAFAAECLKMINQVPDERPVLRQMLWRAAIFHYIKCFGKNKSRSSLSAKKIYTRDAEGLSTFNYFKALRNKHVAHDDNLYSQSLPGAILNRRDKEYKIEKVVCLNVTAETLNQDNYSNLTLLIKTTKAWVASEFDNLCQAVIDELETKPYDELYGQEEITYRKPTVAEMKENRGR